MDIEQKETEWDRILRVKTCGRDDSRADSFHYPYEPTPYAVLEKLAASGYIGKKNHLVDYGCGKGRVDFFLSYQTRCRSVGIEYDDRIWERANANRNTGAAGARTSFVLADAAEYRVEPEADRFYFFNPFSVEILKSVIRRIMESYYENPREIYLFFYYPSDEYTAYLMTVDELMFTDQIDCMDIFEGEDSREQILIFEIQ